MPVKVSNLPPPTYKKDNELSDLIDYSLKIMTSVDKEIDDYLNDRLNYSYEKVNSNIYNVMTQLAAGIENSHSKKVHDLYTQTLGEIARKFVYFKKQTEEIKVSRLTTVYKIN